MINGTKQPQLINNVAGFKIKLNNKVVLQILNTICVITF